MNKLRKNQIDLILKIKPLLKLSLEEKRAKIMEIDELIQRIERLEKMLEEKKPEGVRKTKVKQQIIELLKEKKKLTSSQLGKLIGLSRTRCNEYLRELTREGITEGVLIGRKKYYKLVVK